MIRPASAPEPGDIERLEAFANYVDELLERGEAVPNAVRELASRADAILDGTRDSNNFISIPARRANYGLPLRNAALAMYALSVHQDGGLLKVAASKAAVAATATVDGRDSPHLRGLVRTITAEIKSEIEGAGSLDVARRRAVSMIAQQVTAKGVTAERWVREQYLMASQFKPHDTSTRARQRALRKLLPM